MFTTQGNKEDPRGSNGFDKTKPCRGQKNHQSPLTGRYKEDIKSLYMSPGVDI